MRYKNIFVIYHHHVLFVCLVFFLPQMIGSLEVNSLHPYISILIPHTVF